MYDITYWRDTIWQWICGMTSGKQGIEWQPKGQVYRVQPIELRLGGCPRKLKTIVFSLSQPLVFPCLVAPTHCIAPSSLPPQMLSLVRPACGILIFFNFNISTQKLDRPSASFLKLNGQINHGQYTPLRQYIIVGIFKHITYVALRITRSNWYLDLQCWQSPLSIQHLDNATTPLSQVLIWLAGRYVNRARLWLGSPFTSFSWFGKCK